MRNIIKKHLPTLLAGALSALALPPFEQLWILFIIFPFLLTRLTKLRTIRESLFAGWWFGFGHHLAGLYWIANSLLVDAPRFAWLIPFAVSLIPAVLAVYIAVSALVFKLILRASGASLAVLFFSLAWLASGWIRGHYTLPFPWNLLGYSYSGSINIMQAAHLVGTYGLSLLAVFTCSLPYLLITPLTRRERIKTLPLIITGILLLSAAYAYGWQRITLTRIEFDDSTLLTLVQPNIKQSMKWDPAQLDKNLQTLAGLSNSVDGNRETNIVIWPESAFPEPVSGVDDLPLAVAEVLQKNTYLIAGGVRKQESTNATHYWNSIFTISSEAGSVKIAAVYDKFQLVPFGEYIPLRSLLPAWVSKITGGGGDFLKGTGTKTITVPGTPPFSPMNCYEIIFPGQVIDRSNRPQWILNITNDAWFGDSSGPRQHLAMARFRAVEEGLPVVRVANTGITALIDPFGRILNSIPLNQQRAIQVSLPKSAEIP